MFILCKDELSKSVDDISEITDKLYIPQHISKKENFKLEISEFTANVKKLILSDGRELFLPENIKILTENGFKSVNKLKWNSKIKCSSVPGIPLKIYDSYTNLAYARLCGFFQNFSSMEKYLYSKFCSLHSHNEQLLSDLKLFNETSQFFILPDFETFSMSMKKEFLAAYFSVFDIFDVLENIDVCYTSASNAIIKAEKINSLLNEIGLHSKLKISLGNSISTNKSYNSSNSNCISNKEEIINECLDIEYIMNKDEFVNKIGVRYNKTKYSELYLEYIQNKLPEENLNIDKINYTFSLEMKTFPITLKSEKFKLPKHIFVLNGVICKL